MPRFIITLGAALLAVSALGYDPARGMDVEDWSRLAVGDIEAAYRLQVDNHPAVTPEVADADFVTTLETARRAALRQAQAARSEQGYRRALTAFATALNDSHLGWRPHPHVDAAVRRRPGAGFGVRPVEGGVWIAMEALDERARPVLKTLAGDLAALRSASRIVIDLRGNSGGDSALGDELIAHLYGRGALERVRWLHVSACPSAWRASPGNIAYLREVAATMAAREPGRSAVFEREADRLAEAEGRGRSFADDLTEACLAPDKPSPAQPASDPHTVVLTDEACFSSCLILLERLKALGAVQAGKTTRSGNWYMEVRFEPLPSGRAEFSTLQKVDLSRPRLLGPFRPEIPAPDGLEGNEAYEAWLLPRLPSA